MAQDMGSKNKTVEFVQKYQMYIIAAALVIVAIVYFSVADDKSQNTGSENQNSGQEQVSKPDDQVKPEDKTPVKHTDTGLVVSDDGHIKYSGMLKPSDNLSRGNLMVDGGAGKVYVQTKRDFSKLVDADVTLHAKGSIQKFVFDRFDGAEVLGTDTDAKGGVEDSTAVTVTGTLRASDNLSKGNLMVAVGNSKIYVQSVRDYSALTNSEVVLNAVGTIDSFTQAVIVKKS